MRYFVARAAVATGIVVLSLGIAALINLGNGSSDPPIGPLVVWLLMDFAAFGAIGFLTARHEESVPLWLVWSVLAYAVALADGLLILIALASGGEVTLGSLVFFAILHSASGGLGAGLGLSRRRKYPVTEGKSSAAPF